MNGQFFEEIIGQNLKQAFPYCILSNIPIFRPDRPEYHLWGYEIDHLLHINDLIDKLVIIECKAQNITGEERSTLPIQNGPWNVWYPDQNGIDRPKDVKKQLYNHAKALSGYLQPFSETIPLSFEAWVVSNNYNGESWIEIRNNKISFHLLSRKAFNEKINKLRMENPPLRIEQSALLNEIRKGIPVFGMGHPEIKNALTYVTRCRNAIDNELFRIFKPSRQKWAINGSAGMGKSVVLAYCLFVFASNKIVKADGSFAGNLQLNEFDATANAIGLPAHATRVIYAVARRAKQIRVLEQLWKKFVDQFSVLDTGANISFSNPVFKLWDGNIDDECNILIIDEAHDLEPSHQRAIAGWLNAEGAKHYLVIACDRHQKLRLIGRDAPLIEGLNFSRNTIRLTRNYRNSFSVYAASLALMFRWLATDGVKVVPSKEELKNEFGLNVDVFIEQPGEQVALSLWNDSHPGNYWDFTISKFPSYEAAYNLLSSFELKKDELLWVRFGTEDEFFDYEKLSVFTYHNCFNDEAMSIVDKYIKGQDFPIVVIEGFPPGINLNQPPQNEINDEEKAMWEVRRLIYLCCSRATAFLYFICNPATTNNLMSKELDTLMCTLSQPQNPDAVAGRKWEIKFSWPQQRRKIEDIINLDLDSENIKPPQKIIFERPVTVRSLLIGLNEHDPSTFNDYFKAADFKSKSIYDAVPDDLVRDIVMGRGFIADIEECRIKPLESASVNIVPLRETLPNNATAPIVEYINSSDFNSANSVVEKYLKLLAQIIKLNPKICEYLDDYPARGRIYFDKSENKIYESLRNGGYGPSVVFHK